MKGGEMIRGRLARSLAVHSKFLKGIVCPPLCLIGILATFTFEAMGEQATLSFNHDVRPILSENCFQCHGPDAATREADLRLDIQEEAFKDRDGSIAIVPGNLEESLLVWMIESDDAEDLMPPPDSNKSLSDEEKQILSRWIEEGATYEKHWAFTRPEKSEPAVDSPSPIDGFIKARLQEDGLELSPAADPKTWLRRAALDLTGIPPTVDDYRRFESAVREHGESAFEIEVDRLLASSRYGERMAVDWMDAARYADTHGFNNDSERSMWRWRDWVIEAFNRNLPYDQFIIEQLAGDLLPNPTLDQLIATGFNRNHVISSEGGIIEEEYRVEYVADRVRTVGMVWMGLTTECARCHDHKFDDFSQEDYYRLYGFFNSMVELGEDGRVANAYPTIPSPTLKQQRRMIELEARFAAAAHEKAAVLNRADTAESSGLSLADYGQQVAAATPQPVWKVSSSTQFTEAAYGSPDESGPFIPGVVGYALRSGPSNGAGSIAKGNISVDKETHAFTLAFWIRPDESVASEVPLFSNAQFEREPSSTRYGVGWDIRLSQGEIELSVAQRYPGYSMISRTRNAAIDESEWRHIAIRFKGKADDPYDHTPSSNFSIFVDGEERRLETRYDGLLLPPEVKAFESYLGSDLRIQGALYTGLLDEIQQFDRSLSDDQVLALFRSEALPYLMAKQTASDLSESERQWLVAIVLDQKADSEWLAARDAYREVRGELLVLDRSIPTTMISQDREQVRETFVLNRGHYASPGKKVEPGVPEDLIAPWPENAPLNRLGLAEWLTSDANPLTARVVVNRFWQHLFGVGLVKTSEDFGVQSEFPSHPELLDWLAVDFRESGWDVKRLLKGIVLSRTYRQQSRVFPELLAMDPENRLLARGPRFRLPAETIRDQALALSGKLVEQIGGPSVWPYQPEGIFEPIVVYANYPGTDWLQSEGDDLYRRSLYTYWKRTVPYPSLATFDAPEREVCSVQRSRTNTPLQALVTMNDPTFVEASLAMAQSLLDIETVPFDQRVREAYLTATGRWPEASETNILLAAYNDALDSFQKDPSAIESFLKSGGFERENEEPSPELAASALLMSLILNLDETLTKG